MSITHADAPIYDGLIEERGDVPNSVREAAEETMRSLEADFDFSEIRARP
ncbi:hypothetical protein U9R90_19585 [Streptomyces sp. E11-3]